MGWELSPYLLRDDKNRIIENVWQFGRIFPQVYKQSQYRFGKKVWCYPYEVHIMNYKRNNKGKVIRIEPTDEYWEWREKGMNNDVAVRYPNGYYGKKECICALWEYEEGKYKILDYVESRKKVYCKLYIDSVKKHPKFKELKKRFEKGESFQILDVDGPTLTYENKDDFPYNMMKLINNEIPQKEDWGINEIGSIEATEENIKALLNDSSFPFGHAFCLGCCLMGKEDWLK